MNKKYAQEIDRLLSEMAVTDADTERYTAIVKNLDILMSSKSKEKEDKVDKNTILIVAANLAGIVLILSFEQLNVVSSKALSFIKKI